MKRITARQEAKAQGLPFYRSDKPCKYGHDLLRYTSNGSCVGCHRFKVYPKHYDREKNTIKARVYRERHREHVREYLRDYTREYRKRPYVREYDRQRNRLRWRMVGVARYKDDPEFRARRLAIMRAYHQRHKDDPEFKERNRARARCNSEKRKARDGA